MIVAVILAGCTPPHKYRPIDENATEAAVVLYNRLFALIDKGVMLGHQDDLIYGHTWYGEAGRSDVKEITGDYPAVIGWELGHIEIGAAYNLDSVYFKDMKRLILETYARGGITTASWHGDNIVTGNTAWDCRQDYVVSSVLPGGSHHEQYLTWLDRVADFFLDLRYEEKELVPVIFRMYHENSGGWFWWGSRQCTPEEFKDLWIMTVGHLRDTREVHNLLYCYSPSETRDAEHFLERYPGDRYVDILAYDCFLYGGADIKAIEGYEEKMKRNLETVTSLAAKKSKIAAVGETGMESIPYGKYFTKTVHPVLSGYKVSWILFWRNAWEADKPQHHYLPYPGHSAEADFREFAAKPDILMNKDIN